MTQPAVTFQIKQLEDQFNTRLFDRVGGRVNLTPAGDVALEYAKRILSLSAELEAKMKELTGREVGPLTIGASTTIAEFLLPRVVGEFKSQHPGIVPQLVVANSELVQARVAERSLDIGFIEGDSHLRTLATEVCCDDELQVVCAPAHPLAQRTSLALSNLIDHPYIGREAGSGTREVIGHYLEKEGLAPDALQVVMEASSPEALKGLVTTGLGFAIMSRVTVDKEIRLGELVQIPLNPPLLRRLSVVYPRERIQSKVVNDFIQFAMQRLTGMSPAETGNHRGGTARDGERARS